MRAFEYNSDDVGVSWLPFSHDMGLIGAVLMAVYSRSPCVLLSAFHFLEKPARWLQAVSNYKATVSGGPNFAYDLCVRRIAPEQKAGLDLSRWKIAFNGAETIRYGTVRRFSEAFGGCGFRAEAMYPCYGLAEATLFVAGGARSVLPKTVAVSKEGLGQNPDLPRRAGRQEGQVARRQELGGHGPGSEPPCHDE